MNVALLSIKIDGLQRENPHSLTLTAMVLSFQMLQSTGTHDNIGNFGRFERDESRSYSDKATVFKNSLRARKHRVRFKRSAGSKKSYRSVI